MSRARKSATTVTPARSATRAALLSCTVQPSGGLWRTVYRARQPELRDSGPDAGGENAPARRGQRLAVRQPDRQRIARYVVNAELVMQVRSGGPAGLPDVPDHVALHDAHPRPRERC